MVRTNIKTPQPVPDPVGQSDVAISTQLAATRTERANSSSVYDTIVRVLVLVAAVAIPLFYLPWTSNLLEFNKQLFLVVIASVGLVVWLLGTVIRGKLTIRISPLDKGILALVVAAGIATIFSKIHMVSLFGGGYAISSAFVTLIALALFYFLALNVFHDRGKMLRTMLVISGAMALLLGLLQMFGLYILPGAATHARVFNTIGTLNALGVFAAILLPLFAKTSGREMGRWFPVVPIAGVIFSVAVLAILNWWVLWAIALAGMLSMIAFDSLNVTQLAEDYSGRRNRFALSRFIVPLAVIVVGAFLLLVRFDVVPLKANFPTEVAPSHTLSLRIAYQTLKERPVTGWGPGSFSLAFDRFGAGSLANTQLAGARFLSPTAAWFGLIIGSGPVMLLALLFFLWCVGQVVARFGGAISESTPRGASVATQSVGTLASLLASLVALFFYPFSLTLWFVLFVLLSLAALIVVGERSRTIDLEDRPLYSLAASLGFIVGLIVVLTGTYFVTVRYIADVHYAEAVTRTTPTEALSGLSSAISLNGSDDRYLRDASQATLARLREEIGKSGNDPQNIQNLIASAVQIAQRAAALRPEESLNWNNLGQVYQSLTGLVENVEKLAEDSYHKAEQLRPGDPTFENSIGQMWLSRADLLRSTAQRSGANVADLQQQANTSLANAEVAFKKAIDMSDTYGLAIYNLGAVYDREGRVKEAIRQLEKIAPYNANEPKLIFELGLLYVRDNQKDNARAALQRAVLLAPEYANARWYLALLLEERGDIDGAIVQLNEIVKNNPDNTALQQKIEQLEAGKRAIPPNKVIDTKPLQ